MTQPVESVELVLQLSAADVQLLRLALHTYRICLHNPESAEKFASALASMTSEDAQHAKAHAHHLFQFINDAAETAAEATTLISAPTTNPH